MHLLHTYSYRGFLLLLLFCCTTLSRAQPQARAHPHPHPPHLAPLPTAAGTAPLDQVGAKRDDHGHQLHHQQIQVISIVATTYLHPPSTTTAAAAAAAVTPLSVDDDDEAEQVNHHHETNTHRTRNRKRDRAAANISHTLAHLAPPTRFLLLHLPLRILTYTSHLLTTLYHYSPPLLSFLLHLILSPILWILKLILSPFLCIYSFFQTFQPLFTFFFVAITLGAGMGLGIALVGDSQLVPPSWASDSSQNRGKGSGGQGRRLGGREEMEEGKDSEKEEARWERNWSSTKNQRRKTNIGKGGGQRIAVPIVQRGDWDWRE